MTNDRKTNLDFIFYSTILCIDLLNFMLKEPEKQAANFGYIKE